MVRNLRTLYEPELRPKLSTEIANKLSSLKLELSKPLLDPALTESNKTALKLKAKYSLLDLCFKNMLEIQPDKETRKVWENIKSGHDQIINTLLGIVLGMKPDLERSVSWYKRELDKLKKEMKETLDMTQKLSDEVQMHIKEKEEMAERFGKEKMEFLSKVSQSESQRKPINTPSVKFSPESLEGPSKQFRTELAKGPGKSLSLKQTKEVLYDIYQQKRRYDAKCLENKLPKETMEQYMYTYLNQQYGLKNLILDWTKAILDALAKFSPVDSEVALFAMVLRNECEEGFQYTFLQVKADIIEVLKDHVRAKRKYITEEELETVIGEIVKNPVGEDIWREIVGKLCVPSDQPMLISKIKEKIQREKPTQPERSSRHKKIAREIEPVQKRPEQKLLFGELQNLLLEYMLVRHELNIQKFVDIFKRVDQSGNGVLDEDGFRDLVQMLEIEIEPALVNKLLATLDPYKNQKITFSDCLAVFSTVSRG
eukprot:TRINITY_DN2542_c0_g1_i1.p1 TRINITY_DN2542_c0_g1~~TRINITY_DN2542_c0_g1_i1.p1  ORF type:complete len:483 (+),score=72.66 TRINITY_DN2542_c0_g1_i1:2084-3532(+)